MGKALGHLRGRPAAGATPAGPPLTRYFTFGEPAIEFECAIPVAAPFAGHGDIKPSSVGGGDAVVCTHVGPYDTIGQTWEALTQWVSEQGRSSGVPVRVLPDRSGRGA